MAGRFDIVTTGQQDVYLTGDPQMSHFLSRFKRHTHFAFEVNECQFDGLVDYGGTLNCKIPQSRADFIKNITIKLARDSLLPRGTSWCPSFMSHLIEFAELYIGGRLIEKITGEYIYLYQQLRNNDYDTRQTLYFLTGHGDLLDIYDKEYIYFLDLPFYFYRNPELSIPICALSKQNVEVNIKLRKFNEVILDPSSYGGKINRISLNVENIYVTPEEKSFFMSNEINHLITQLQISRFKMKNNELKKDILLNLQNPVREMFFVSQSNVSVNSNFSNQYNTIKNVKLKLNNEILFNKTGKEVGYDHVLEKYMNSPIASNFGGPIEIEQRKFGPCVFGHHSFALNPMKPGPSGHINMSRIGHKLLSIEIEPLSNININTLSTNIVTENFIIPFTKIRVNQIPFTDIVTENTQTITTTPVTITNNIVRGFNRLTTTVSTIIQNTSRIGLSYNPVQPGNGSGGTTSTVSTQPTGVVNVFFVSSVDGIPVVNTNIISSSTVTTLQDVVEGTLTETTGQKTSISTASEDFSNVFIRTGVLPIINNPTQITIVNTNSSENTSTPVRVVGNIDTLLLNSVDSTPVITTLSTSSSGATQNPDGPTFSGGTTTLNDLINSTVIFSLTNPIYSQASPGTVTSTSAATVGGGGSGNTFIRTTALTNIRFDTYGDETAASNHGSCSQMSRNGERIITTHNDSFLGNDSSIYRHILGIPQPFRKGGSFQTPGPLVTVGETYINERFVSVKDARLNASSLSGGNYSFYFHQSAKKTATNLDGSIIAGSNFYPMNYVGFSSDTTSGYRDAIDIWGYTENWAANQAGNGSWARTDQLAKPAGMNECNFGHSISMNDAGDRFAVSGVAYFIDTETLTGQAKARVQPQYGVGSCNKVVIYDYDGSSWNSTVIDLPANNQNHGIQVALSGDGNTLCVTHHGNSTGYIECTGRVFVYTSPEGMSQWSGSEKILPSGNQYFNNVNSMFGRSISVNRDGTRLVIGAPGWGGGRVFLYHLVTSFGFDAIEEISSYVGYSGSTGITGQLVFGFGNGVAISSDGTRVLISSIQGPVELWNLADYPATSGPSSSFNSYNYENGPFNGVNDISDVSINEDGTKYAFSSGSQTGGGGGSEKIYEGGSAGVFASTGAAVREFEQNSAYDFRTFRYPETSFFSYTILRMPPYEVQIQLDSIPFITTSTVITPFDTTEQVTVGDERVEETNALSDDTITGVENTTVTIEGIRSQTEITATGSLVTVPIVPDQEHDTRVYAVNYNVLTFRDGLAGLRF